jgi:ribonuclease HI
MVERLLIRTDGASRSNPGPASAGAVLIDASRPDATAVDAPPLSVVARPLGVQTNNVAEYTALLLALDEAKRLGARSIDLRLDSKLIVEQLHGRWKVKDPKMRVLWSRAQELLAGFDSWSATHEPRATNKAADALANLALDDPVAAAMMEARYRP